MFKKGFMIWFAFAVAFCASPVTAAADISEFTGRYALTDESRVRVANEGMPGPEIEQMEIVYVLKSLGGLEFETRHGFSFIAKQNPADPNHFFMRNRRIEARFFPGEGKEMGLEGNRGPYTLHYVRTQVEPGGEDDLVWERKKPADLGFDSSKLDEAVGLIRSNEYVNIHGLLVLKDGFLILEEYFNGSDPQHIHQIRSAGKSISSIVTGLAIEHGYLKNVREPIAPFFPEYEPESGWDPKIRQVNVESLLTMTSGFGCDDWKEPKFICEMELFRSKDWVKYALDCPMAHPPGSHWAYNSAALMLLGGVVSQATKMSADQFARAFLFEPLNIESYIYRLSPRGRPFFGGSSKMTARDMAKIGHLFLNQGNWFGRQVVSADWIQASTGAQVMTVDEREYGYLWWRGTNIIKGRVVEEFSAEGNGGQDIFVFPEIDMVAVFTGGNYNDSLGKQPFDILTEFILPAVLPDPPPETDLEIDPQWFKKLAGKYVFQELNLDIQYEDNRLTAGLTGPFPTQQSPLTPLSRTRFIAQSQKGPTLVAFHQGENGRITHLKAHRNWHCTLFDRVDTTD